MKNISRELDDSLRPEYRRADFGELVKGKYAWTQLEFADLVHVLITFVAEEEGVNVTRHSSGNYLASHQSGDWTYELDNSNQITLRYWFSEFGNVEEPLSNLPCITTPQQRLDLQNLLTTHIKALKARVGAP